MKGACGIVESKASLRWEIIEGLTHIAGCWKWGDHRSLMEIGHELTRLTLDGGPMSCRGKKLTALSGRVSKLP